MNKLLQFLKNYNSHNHGSSEWSLEYFKFEPGQERLREALCTLGNGYLGTRGAVTESSASRIHYPGTYMAGIYNKLESHISGKTITNEDLVNCPNWLPLTFKTEEKSEWIIPSVHRVVSYYRKLDLKKAVLVLNYKIKEKSGKITSVQTRRIVHMDDMHRMAIEYSVIPENYSGEIFIRTGLDGTVKNEGVERYSDLNSLHLAPDEVGQFGENNIYLTVITNQSKIKIAQASSLSINSKDEEIKPIAIDTKKEEKAIFQEHKIKVNKKQKYTIEKNVSIYTSKDKDTVNPLESATELVKQSPDFSTLYESNKKAWSELWDIFDIKVKGHTFSQKALRLHIFHLLETASFHNTKLDVGIPARGLSGEAYRGHIFWDELFILPVYDFRIPKITQSTLLYRYRRLEQARKYAQENDYRGAMFPWQSGSTGEEETQIIHLNPKSGKWGPDHSRNQRHVSFDIAYSIWDHWKIARDFDFLINYGAEMFLSIALFGASLAYYDEKDKRYHTKGLMGPDEFHERLPGTSEAGFKDNAYTNIMIVWTLKRALDLLSILPSKRKEELIKELSISQEELKLWDNISKKMNIIINKEGIISQFDGYFRLKELNWKAYKKKYGNIQRMDRILKAEGKSPNDYKVAKQADTLMLPYLFPFSELKGIFKQLGYDFTKTMLRKNYNYYVQRTSHGSTLSKVVHCYLSDIIGETKQSWKWYCEVLNSDINDIQGGTTPEGIHTGVMGGSVYIAIKRYAGVNLIDGIINIEPDIPVKWKNINFKIKYKDVWHILEIDRRKITLELLGSKPKSHREKIIIQNKEYFFNLNQKHVICLKRNGEMDG
ncbi:MAG: glycoside hydrolase family 65 protein [Elusimicrobiota bacterium]